MSKHDVDKVLYDVSVVMSLDFDDYQSLVDDVHNLRGEEWIDNVQANCSDEMFQAFCDAIGFDTEVEVEVKAKIFIPYTISNDDVAKAVEEAVVDILGGEIVKIDVL